MLNSNIEKQGENDCEKFAVASEKDMVAEHFGHCEEFQYIEVEE